MLLLLATDYSFRVASYCSSIGAKAFYCLFYWVNVLM